MCYMGNNKSQKPRGLWCEEIKGEVAAAISGLFAWCPTDYTPNQVYSSEESKGVLTLGQVALYGA